jgi:phosphatidylglycerol lysyltransferase
MTDNTEHTANLENIDNTADIANTKNIDNDLDTANTSNIDNGLDIENTNNIENSSNLATTSEVLCNTNIQSSQTMKSAAQEWPVYLVSTITLLSGLAGTWEPLLMRLSSHPRLFNTLVPYELYHLSNTLTIAFGYLLIFLSVNLYQRKKTAWWIAISLSALSLALQLARLGSEHIHWLENQPWATQLPSYSLAPSLAALIALGLTRSKFSVRSAKDTFLQAAKIITIALFAVVIYGCLGFFLLDKRDFGVNFELDQALIHTLKELTLVGNSDLTASTKFGNWFIESLRLSGILAGAAIVISAFRPIRYKLLTEPLEHELAASILDQYGRSALDLFKLLPDKSYFFNADKDGFVAYKTALGVAIVLGDATAPEEKLSALINDFKIFAHDNGWQVAFLQTSSTYLEIYKKNGFRSVKVGEDGVVDLEKFVTTTLNKKTFKSSVKKFDKEGFVLNRYSPPLSNELLDEVQEVSNQWLALPGRRERGFSLGQFNREELQHNDIFVLRDKDGQALAFVNQIRSYSPHEVTIDMMRHKENVPNGSMDFLFAKLLKELHAEGFKFFSLGLAALAGVGDEPNDPLEEKALHQVYEHLNRFFSYKGLRSYKEKFDPNWEERFLIYEGGPPGLIKAGLAIAKATED